MRSTFLTLNYEAKACVWLAWAGNWVRMAGERLDGEHGSAGRLAEPRGGCAAVGGGAFVPFRWAVPPPYSDATIAFVTVRE